MSFSDIFESDFLNRLSVISYGDMIIAIVLALVIGLFIAMVYRQSYSGVMYSPSFALTLVALTMITTILIMTVVSNVVLSLGMVGALSIVRFRSAIKEPMDIAFLFWSISIGIILAAGLLSLALIGSLAIGSMLVVFSRIKVNIRPYILVIHCKQDLEKTIQTMVKTSCTKVSLKSKSIMDDHLELNYEVRLKDEDSTFLNHVHAMDGIIMATLVSYNGDYLS